MDEKTKVKRHLRRLKKKKKVTVVRRHKRRIKRKNRGASVLSEMIDKLSKKELERILNRDLSISEIPLTKAQLKKEIKKLDFPIGGFHYKKFPLNEKVNLVFEIDPPIDKFTLETKEERKVRDFITEESIRRGKLRKELKKILTKEKKSFSAFPGTCTICGRQGDLSVLKICKQCEKRRESEAFANFGSTLSPRARIKKGSKLEKALKELEKEIVTQPVEKPKIPIPKFLPTKITAKDIEKLRRELRFTALAEERRKISRELGKARITPAKLKKAEARQKELREKFLKRELRKRRQKLKTEMDEKLKLEIKKLREKFKRKPRKKPVKKKVLKRKPVKRVRKKAKPKLKKKPEKLKLKTLAESDFESVVRQLEDITRVGGRVITKKQKK